MQAQLQALEQAMWDSGAQLRMQQQMQDFYSKASRRTPFATGARQPPSPAIKPIAAAGLAAAAAAAGAAALAASGGARAGAPWQHWQSSAAAVRTWQGGSKAPPGRAK